MSRWSNPAFRQRRVLAARRRGTTNPKWEDDATRWQRAIQYHGQRAGISEARLPQLVAWLEGLHGGRLKSARDEFIRDGLDFRLSWLVMEFRRCGTAVK